MGVSVEPVGHIYGGWVNVRLGLGLLDGCVCRTSWTYIWWVGECPTGIRSIRCVCVCVEPVGHIYGGWVNVRLGLGLLGVCVCVCVEQVGHIW